MVGVVSLISRRWADTNLAPSRLLPTPALVTEASTLEEERQSPHADFRIQGDGPREHRLECESLHAGIAAPPRGWMPPSPMPELVANGMAPGWCQPNDD